MRAKLEQERIRGEEARQLLENKLLQASFSLVEKRLLDQMLSVPITDVAMHTRLILARQMLYKIIDSLKVAIDTGKLASMQLRE